MSLRLCHRNSLGKFIDELIVLDVSRGQRDIKEFGNILKELSLNIFTPIASGGGISTYEEVNSLFKSGADKIVINTSFFTNNKFVESLSK